MLMCISEFSGQKRAYLEMAPFIHLLKKRDTEQKEDVYNNHRCM